MIILILFQIDAKQVQKRSSVPGEIPTLGGSDDHTDGTWGALDVYDGELFLNLADGKMFAMIGGKVYEFGTKKEKIVVNNIAGETIFTLPKNILSDVALFEDGVLTTKVVTITDTNEVTTGTPVADGTVVEIIY